MKTYLNREEKQTYFILNGYVKYMHNLINGLIRRKASTEIIKNVKLSRTYTNKSLNELIKNIDKDQMNNLIKESSKTQVVAKYSNEAIEEFERMKKMDSITPMETDDLLDLFGHCIKVCQFCKIDVKTSEQCIAKKIMLKYGCEIFNYDATDKQCPYQYCDIGEII